MVGAMAGFIWLLGVVMKSPRAARWNMIFLLLVAVMALQIILPDGHPLREATGGDARLWALIVALGFAIYGYSLLLRRLRARAQLLRTCSAKSFIATAVLGCPRRARLPRR